MNVEFILGEKKEAYFEGLLTFISSIWKSFDVSEEETFKENEIFKYSNMCNFTTCCRTEIHL